IEPAQLVPAYAEPLPDHGVVSLIPGGDARIVCEWSRLPWGPMSWVPPAWHWLPGPDARPARRLCVSAPCPEPPTPVDLHHQPRGYRPQPVASVAPGPVPAHLHR